MNISERSHGLFLTEELDSGAERTSFKRSHNGITVMEELGPMCDG